MNPSTRAISLVLISGASILAAHHAFDTLRQGYRDLDAEGDSWVNGSPTTQSTTRRSGSGGYYGHSHYYSSGYRSSGGGSSWSSSSSSSGSSSAHGTSVGGFGGTAHGSAS